MQGYTGKTTLLGIDECGDAYYIASWDLRGDLQSPDELEYWKTCKVRQAKKSGKLPEESIGYDWIDDLQNAIQEAEEDERRYNDFIKNIYPELYNGMDIDEAYADYLYDIWRAENDGFII